MKFNNEFNLGANEGSPNKARKRFIIIHDTGNDNNKGSNSGRNEAAFMKSHWRDAYTHAIVDDTNVYIVGAPEYVAYGAGMVANDNSPMQIELAHVDSKKRFDKSYKLWIKTIQYFAKKYGIPLTLDTDIHLNGIKTHKWVSDNIWGDHTDPYGYLAKWGITKRQLQLDLVKTDTTNVVNEYYQSANQVKALTSVSRYKDKGFKQKVDTFPKGTLFDINATVKYGSITRFKLANGLYITSNKKYVKKTK